MMQQVATPNADIAAFAANTTKGDPQDSAFAEDFGKLLQQHQDARGSSEPTNKAMNKTREQAAPSKLEQEQKSPAVNDTKTASEMAVVINEKSKVVDDHSCAEGCGAEEVASEAKTNAEAKLKTQLISDINELVGQFDLAKSNAQSTDNGSDGTEISAYVRSDDGQTLGNETKVWSSLVEKLHTLAGRENTASITPEGKQLLAEDVANMVQQSLGDKGIPIEELAANLLENHDVSSKENVRLELNQSSALPQLTDKVSQILNEIDSSQLNSSASDADIQVDGLLDKLAALQGVFEARKSTASSGQEIKEKSLGVAIDTNVTTKNEAQQQIISALGTSERESTTEQLSDKVNKSLVATVLSPSSVPKDNVNAETLRRDVAAFASVENVAGPESDLATVDVQTQLQEITPTASGGKEAPSKSSLEVLAGMSAEKLDKTLNNLLQRLATEQSSSEIQNVQLNPQQAAAVAANQVDQPALVHANKDFIAALKAGVDEFKAQLAQGREPGLDLKGLVADAMSKSADSTGAMSKQADQIESAVKGFSQVLDFAQQLNGALEQHQANTLSHNNYMAREVGQNQIEQLKQFQAQTSQFDKAVNISKPEGHQQLAEKVRWMVNAKQLVAEIRLDPAELGSMQVKVSMTGESANISFVVQSHLARDAMESATPRLREMLAEKGIELGQSSVKQDQGQAADAETDQHASRNHSGGEHGIDNAHEDPNEAFTQQPIVNGALGGIDYFV